MNWAIGADGQTAFSEHVAAGGAVINLSSGDVAVTEDPTIPVSPSSRFWGFVGISPGAGPLRRSEAGLRLLFRVCEHVY